MHPKLGRRFATREDLTGGFVRRLSDRGLELDVPGDVAPPTGTVIDLDFRLEDGSHLIVGTGEVTEGGKAGTAFRVRFLELSPQSRAGLSELIAQVTARKDEPSGPGARDGGEPGSLLDLVEEAYGGSSKPAAIESSSILVPPDPEPGPAAASGPSGSPRPKPAEAPPGSGASPEPNGNERPSLLRRLGISPGVIVVAIIAGATGAAANAWFQDLAAFVGELTAEPGDVVAPEVIHIPPSDVRPSDFSAEPEAAEPSDSPGLSGAAETGAEAASAPETAGTAGTDEASPPSRPADRVRLITWDEGPSETVVTFWGNGVFLEERVVRVRVAGGQPRELIKLRGIDLPYPETVIEPSTSELERIRTGFHPRAPVNELHVVLDLAGPDVRLDRVEHGERTLRFHLRTVAPTPADAAAQS